MRLALVANPASGGGTDPATLAARLRAHAAEVDVHPPSELAAVAAAPPDRLVVAGGDGSIAPGADLAARLRVPLAVIPAGTANDFARAHGLPDDAEAACALAASPGAATRALDLGRLGAGRPFVNVASAGLASAAARQAAGVKHHLGPLAYGVGAVAAAVLERPLTVVVLADHAPAFHGRAWQVIVAVTGHFGAGSHLGIADPTDGMLDVAVVPAGSRAGLAWRALGMRSGRLADQRGVCHARGGEIEVHLAPGTELNVDGELARAATPERITLEPRAYALVVP